MLRCRSSIPRVGLLWDRAQKLNQRMLSKARSAGTDAVVRLASTATWETSHERHSSTARGRFAWCQWPGWKEKEWEAGARAEADAEAVAKAEVE
eukprot:2710114-Pyramimonas_sp.AAC.1